MSFVRRSLPLALAAVALVAAGCGSKSKDKSASTSTPAAAPATTPAATPTTAAPAGGASTVKLSADPSQLAFNTKTLTAKSGKVTLDMANPSGVPHAIAVEGNGVDKDGQTVTQGGTSTVTVDLKPGKYQFYCPVDGHKAAGMEGTLTVS
jgi:plastocyanin